MRFRILVITSESFQKKEVHFICKLFACGLGALHVRKPNASKEEVKNYLRQIPSKFYKKIVLHDHYELINELKLRGAHLTSKSRKAKHTLANLKKNKIKIISTSFHSMQEVNRNRRIYEYVFLSPVFNSISKNNYKSKFELEKLKPFLKRKQNIIALGGIAERNIEIIKQTGFSGAATIGFIWKSKDPEKNYNKLVSKIK